MTQKFKAGLCGVGLDAYWPQFEGLKKRLEGYLTEVYQQFDGFGVEVDSAGLIDSPERAQDGGYFFREKNVDILFIYLTTYALSSYVLPLVRRAGVPVVFLNLIPEPALDYAAFNALENRTKMTGEWLAWCGSCPAPEMANVMKRAGIPFHEVSGALHGDQEVWKEVEEWLQAARVMQGMSVNRLGLMGNYYGGMLDVYSDLTQQLVTFGGHIEMIEVDELTSIRKKVGEEEIDRALPEFSEQFDIHPDCHPEEIRESVKTAIALDRLIEEKNIGSLAYYYKGKGTDNEDTIRTLIPGCSLLTARGIPAAGEYEVKNVQAMKVLSLLGVGGSFTEFYGLDLEGDFVLMGHDGPGHLAIASGKTRLKPLDVYHGKVAKGLSVEMSVRPGAVTLLSVVENQGQGIMLLVAEGESVEGPILEIGNTNSRYIFQTGARGFVQAWNSHGPAHHCAVGVGHVAGVIKKLGELLKIEVIQVC